MLDSHGNVRETIHGNGINGPWDMTALDHGSIAELFVTNVLNGTVAASPDVRERRHRAADPARDRAGNQPPLIIDHHDRLGLRASGPTRRRSSSARPASASAPNGTLYVADTVDNRIAAIPDAVLRSTVGGRRDHGQPRTAR